MNPITEQFFEGTPFLVRGKAYHSQLPAELEKWYCYTNDGGHSILCLLEGRFEETSPDWQSLCPVPVKAALRGYRQVGDFVAVDLPYSDQTGLHTPPTDDEF